MQFPIARRRPLLVVLASALLIGGCSSASDGSDGTGAPDGATLTDLVLRESGTAGLFSFSVRLSSARLEREAGGLSDELLPGPMDLDLVRPGDAFEWLARADVDRAVYSRLVLEFEPGEYRASDLQGLPVSVVPASDVLRVSLTDSALFTNSAYVRIEATVDLGASLAVDPSAGTAVFDPMGAAILSRGTVPVSIENILGRVLDRDLAAQELAVELFADQELVQPLGMTRVKVPNSALLIDNLGNLHAQVAFYFTFLTPGLSIIEISGDLGRGGQFGVERVELEDQNGIVAVPRFPLKLRGEVVAVTTLYTARLRVRSIERGGELLGVPPASAPVIDVLFDPQSALYYIGNGLLPPEYVEVGVELVLKSEQLLLDPFAASRVEFAGALIATIPVSAGSAGRLAGAELGAVAEDYIVSRGGSIERSFGPGLPAGDAGSLRIALRPTTRIQGDASSIPDLAALAASASDVLLTVEGEEAPGLGHITADSITVRIER